MEQFRRNVLNYNGFFLFEGLTQTQIQKITQKFEPICSFSKGEVIYSEKTFLNAIGYILEGTVSAHTNNNSGVVMKRFSKGMSFGAAAVFGKDNCYVSTVVALSDCKIQFINEKTLCEVFSEYPETAINYINFLSEKVRFLNKKLGIISCGSAEDKVFKYLIDSADENANVTLPNNISLLARTLGVGRTSLYRSLEALEKSGKIIKENNIIRVKKL